MRHMLSITILFVFSFSAMFALAQEPTDPLAAFEPNAEWTVTAPAPTAGEARPASSPEASVISNTPEWRDSGHLVSHAELSDSLLKMEYLSPNSSASVFLHGSYALELPATGNEWRTLTVKFRAPRFDAARNKVQNALILEARAGEESIASNRIMDALSPGAAEDSEDPVNATTLLANQGPFSFRNFSLLPADFEHVTLPAESGGATNADSLVDFVALGKETFESVGCSACHSIAENDRAVTSGPNLFGLIKREPRMREVLEGGEDHRFSVAADRSYLHRSLRAPAEQLAIAESGAKKGEAYPPLMPAFSEEVLTDVQIEAIGAYLATLNDAWEQGPAIQLLTQSGTEEYDPMADDLQLLVDDEVRIQRGPMQGVSGRAIHVGQPNGVNYSFDPRILGIVKVWQGGFIDRRGELVNRGGKGLKMGYESREVSLGDRDFVFAPLDSRGELIDFSFKEAKFGDSETVRASLYSERDHFARVAAMNAKFLGYSRNSKDKLQTPRFRFSIGDSLMSVQTDIAANGDVQIHLEGSLANAQSFAFNTQALHQAHASHGEVQDGRWTLPAGTSEATLSAKMALATNVWRPSESTFDYRKQPVRIETATAQLPAGYSIESYHAPKDNYGREQLFEALGLALASDGAIVVATRTAGVWLLENGQWHLFAEGMFDSLGVLTEAGKGRSLIVGQKAELTRISDTNGDGIADEYETLFDAHSYHGNYHAYLHGPVRGADGAYYFNLNLSHAYDESIYKAGGGHMGTMGGFSGWTIRVQPDGKFSPFANGLRSPAGLGVAPDGRLWYADNQGEFVGTSKLFVLRKNGFYGHPAGLVDLPGMTPKSPEIAWARVAARRERPVVLFPHNRVANSPGNPAWDTTNGKFGPFAGQMLIGDQTQSNLLRVATQVVEGIEQGSVMPFMDGLESGVMRPLFLRDGSLLLGQTGRGWQAKGGHVASLQRIRWDGRTIAPAIRRMLATPAGFRVELTQPLDASVSTDRIEAALRMESWVYRDAPDYGSDELDLHEEEIASIALSEDRKHIDIELASLHQPQVHPQQTARVYHAQLATAGLFNAAAADKMDVYYTLYAFPGAGAAVLSKSR